MAEFFDILVRFVHPSDRRVDDSAADVAGSPWLRLEQAPLVEPNADGFEAWFAEKYGTTQSEYTFAQLMAFYDQFTSLCGEDGEFTAEIWVHKSSSELGYRLDASRGDWLYDQPQSEQEQKTMQLAVRDESSTIISDENIQHVVCAQWEGNVYDQHRAQVIPRPTIELDPETFVLSWGQRVTGTIRAVVIVEYDVWHLVISPRSVAGSSVEYNGGPGSNDNGGSTNDGSGYGISDCTETFDEDRPSGVYAATVYGVYSGGIETLEVESPDLKGFCADGGSSVTVPGDPDGPGDCYRLKVVYHKCTGEEKSRELIQVPCE